MTQKAIIFDSGTLISFTMSSLIPELRKLKEIFDGKFIITHDVKNEIIDKPLNIKKFELDALRLEELLKEGILEMPDSLGIKNKDISRRTEEILGVANNTFFQRNKPIKLIHFGEASCLALSRILDERKIENVIAVDERTTRMFSEKPENLRKLLQKKFHSKIDAREENYKNFKGFKFIRSPELVFVAYKKGLVDLGKKDKRVLDALLYSVKFKGAAISGEEIKQMKNLV